MWPHTTNADDTHYNLIFPCQNNQHPLNCTTECLGEPGSEGKPRNSGVSGMGQGHLPSSWTWAIRHTCAFSVSLSEQMPKREMLY